jgi:NAD(P)-dependent dehydrogenase (short-subunit alcohol dehydrogenase family)
MALYSNKIVVVTGAGKGIGISIAQAYAAEGARLALLDRDAEDLHQTENQIRESGAEVFSQVVDLTQPDGIVSVFDQVKKMFGRIDILINNAGLGKSKSPYELDIEDWDYVLNTNLRGTFICSREAAKVMRENGGGSIVNIASTRALMSEPDTEAYAASKGGILALTHAMAISLGKDKIMVNAISPGWIETGDYSALKPSDHRQHPAGRVGQPEDISRACLFLTNPENNFITGTNFVIDGGMTRKMIYEE